MKNIVLAILLLIGVAGFGAAGPRAGSASDISGTWIFSVDLEGGGHGDPTFVFKQEGEKVAGSYTGPLGEQKVTGSVKGDKAVFGFEALREGQTLKATYNGTIESPTKMTGTVVFNEGEERGKWTANKKP